MQLFSQFVRWVLENESALDMFVLVVTAAGNLGGVATVTEAGPTIGLLKSLIGGDMLALIYLGLRVY